MIIGRKVRKEVLERDNHECQICGGKGGLVLHHKIPIRIQRRLNTKDNLITLCVYCHIPIERGCVGAATVYRLKLMGLTKEWFFMKCFELGIILDGYNIQ